MDHHSQVNLPLALTYCFRRANGHGEDEYTQGIYDDVGSIPGLDYFRDSNLSHTIIDNCATQTLLVFKPIPPGEQDGVLGDIDDELKEIKKLYDTQNTIGSTHTVDGPWGQEYSDTALELPWRLLNNSHLHAWTMITLTSSTRVLDSIFPGAADEQDLSRPDIWADFEEEWVANEDVNTDDEGHPVWNDLEYLKFVLVKRDRNGEEIAPYCFGPTLSFHDLWLLVEEKRGFYDRPRHVRFQAYMGHLLGYGNAVCAWDLEDSYEEDFSPIMMRESVKPDYLPQMEIFVRSIYRGVCVIKREWTLFGAAMKYKRCGKYSWKFGFRDLWNREFRLKTRWNMPAGDSLRERTMASTTLTRDLREREYWFTLLSTTDLVHRDISRCHLVVSPGIPLSYQMFAMPEIPLFGRDDLIDFLIWRALLMQRNSVLRTSYDPISRTLKTGMAFVDGSLDLSGTPLEVIEMPTQFAVGLCLSLAGLSCVAAERAVMHVG